VAVGYRYREVKLKKLPELTPRTRIGKHREDIDPLRRPIVAASLGCHVQGMAMPNGDPADPVTFEAGVRKRFAMKPPKADPALRVQFRVWWAKTLREEFTPLSPDTDVTFDCWIKETPYSEARKNELRTVYDKVWNIRDPAQKYFRVKGFKKDESYPEYKHVRPINSRSDAFKCEMGRFFRAIEKEMYKHPFFIKHVPIAQRPKHLAEKFREGPVVESDWEACEAHFDPEFMEDCEFQFYDYMTSKLAEHDHFMWLCRNVLAGMNEVVYRYFIMFVYGKRMSGEMNTSCGNGITNYAVNRFMMEVVKKMTDLVDEGEGDDGLFQGNGEYPTEKDYARLGVSVKLVTHKDISTASFCGIIFDPVDQTTVTDPMGVLASFGWTTNQYARSRSSKLRGLLRCKALSYAHQYPSCPIVTSLARYGLRVTRDAGQCARDIVFKSRHFNLWQKEMLTLAFKDEKSLVFPRVGSRTRDLVEEKFGITVAVQLQVEKYLDSLDSIHPLNLLPLIQDSVPESWTHFWDNYVRLDHIHRYDLESPGWEQPLLFNKPEWLP
jgi:hypothetical protein